MQQNIMLRIFTLVGLTLLFLIPLGLIRGVVSERLWSRNGAQQDIARSWSGSQNVFGPILEIEYKKRTLTNHYDPVLKTEVTKEHWQDQLVYLLPEQLKLSNQLNTEERYRGIYSFPVYSANIRVAGKFNAEKLAGLSGASTDYRFVRAKVLVGVSDIRGINNQPSLNWGKGKVTFQPGTDGKILPQGIHAIIDGPDWSVGGQFDFSYQLELRGMDELNFAPLGKITEVEASASWPHPKFTGMFLPEGREITESGFRATWRTSYFATNAPQLLKECSERNSCSGFNTLLLGVSLFDPVNIYHQTERSLKYGILFVGLTFLAAFLFEVMRQLRIHPIQYLLIGCALGIFYLLLISLSEHIAFSASYLIASVACSLLLLSYFSAILGNKRWALVFTCGIAALYGVLYVLLQSEDHALLMGTVLLFTALSAVMILTRRIDWYELNQSMSKVVPASSPLPAEG